MKCVKCGYEWAPRVEKPKQCPRCKQYIVYDRTWYKQDQEELIKEIKDAKNSIKVKESGTDNKD